MAWTSYLVPALTFALGALTVIALYIQAGYRTDFLSRLRNLDTLRRFHSGLDAKFREPRTVSGRVRVGYIVAAGLTIPLSFIGSTSVFAWKGVGGIGSLLSIVYIGLLSAEVVLRNLAERVIRKRKSPAEPAPTALGAYVHGVDFAAWAWFYCIAGVAFAVLNSRRLMSDLATTDSIGFLVEIALLSALLVNVVHVGHRRLLALNIEPWLATEKGIVECRVFLIRNADPTSGIPGRLKGIGDSLWLGREGGWEAEIPWSSIDRIEVKRSVDA